MKTYQENIKKYDAKLGKLTKLLNRISLLRLLVFILLIAILIYLFKFKLLTSILLVFPLISIISFGVVIKYHNKIAYKKKHTTFLKRINELQLEREKCNLEGFDPGHTFIDHNHPYTSDLDIFGQHSIFQLLNRTTTESGTIRLSEWLSEPAPNNEIRDRQKAIAELSPKVDWRQDFQASGMHHQNKKSDYYQLLAWIETPNVLLKNGIKYTVGALILSVLSLLSFYFSLANLHSSFGLISFITLLVVLVINALILRKVKTVADDIVETSEGNMNTLKGYRILIHKIEGKTFKSKKLSELQSILTKGEISAYNEINRLCRLLQFSQQRGVHKIKMPMKGNLFYSILNVFVLLDIYLIVASERWKAKNKTFIQPWAEAVSDFEVICSLAGYAHANPTYAFPEITEKHNYVHFESLGHPLIHSDVRVCNDFHSEGHGDVVMVTGSNMAGKSTFLRAVGVNLVLALAGAPICAKYGKVSNLKVFTSMRTQDNLEKGISSFYAELNRIEKMLKLVESSYNVFFLLDEMFKGTNSEDRHKGGFSLINQLSKLKTSGIIATHDIKLARLSENKKLVTNYSFNSEIINDSMIFSYKLQPVICNDFNASELMKKSGINVLSNSLEERS